MPKRYFVNSLPAVSQINKNDANFWKNKIYEIVNIIFANEARIGRIRNMCNIKSMKYFMNCRPMRENLFNSFETE